LRGAYGKYSVVNFLVLCAAVAAVLGALATAGPAANADTPGSAVRGPGFGQIAGGMLGSASVGRGREFAGVRHQPGASGYVAGPDVALGVPVRSNGGIQVFQGGTAT
jgi:hypothetical protein